MLPPLRFHALPKARAWGPAPERSNLARLGKEGLPNARVGESWEIADLPDSIDGGQLRVLGGPFDGRTLRELRLAHGEDLLGVATPAPDGGFPLLVKFLDAAENLSLQVHPDAEYVRDHPGAHLKTEAWIVLAAKRGARVYRGLKPSTTRETFLAAVEDGRALEHLETIPVTRGDCVYLPSGICHALGEGILVAEVQTPSDTTFRVWDWQRNDPKRPLHLAEAFACMRFGAAQSDGRPPIVRFDDIESIEAAGLSTRLLCESSFFRVEWMDALFASSVPIAETGVPEVWMTIAGRARWKMTSGTVEAPAGTTILRPAHVETGRVELDEGCTILRLFCTSPLDRAL
ncbi:MAG: type I phosphomannose isomerase catalytic subunit [bacterium]